MSEGITLVLLLPDVKGSIEGIRFAEFFVLSTRVFDLIVSA
jgi:hypothetical protein